MCAALQKSDSDVKAMKKQAENLTTEYDRLLDEHGRLQVRAHACHTANIFPILAALHAFKPDHNIQNHRKVEY